MNKKQETIFLKAIEENQNKIFRICSIYSRDSEDAKDLFQEVLINIWRALPKFKSNSSINTWIFKIALNVCLRVKLKSTKNKNILIRLDSLTIANIGSEEKNDEEHERLNSLRACVKLLNESDKAIVALYLEGLVYREISIILGLTENHIAVKVKRIKLKLLNCINKLL